MKDIIKNSALVGSTEFSLIIIAIIRNKYLALSIGPEGFGIYGLLNSFFSLAAVFGGSWLATGATKYMAEFNNENKNDSVSKVFNFVYILTFTLSTAVALISLIFYSLIEKYFLSPKILFLYYILFAASFIGTNLKSNITSLLQGLLEIKKIVYLRIVTSFIEFLSILILVYLFDLSGFFISILISAIFSATLFYFSIRKIINSKIQLPLFKDAVSKKLLKFGGINFFLGLINLLSAYLQRIIILARMDMIAVGFFQAISSMMNYLGILNRGSAFFFLPKMSENLVALERNKKLDEYMRFTMLTGIPVSVLTILFGGHIIQILYAKSFIGLSDFLFLFVFAQFVISIELAYQGVVVGMAQLRIHSVSTILNHLFWIIIPLFLMRSYGLNSVALGFVLGSISAILIDATYLKIKCSISVSLRIYALLTTAVIIIFLSLICKDSSFYIKLSLVIVSLSLIPVIMTKNELRIIFIAAKRAFGLSV